MGLVSIWVQAAWGTETHLELHHSYSTAQAAPKHALRVKTYLMCHDTFKRM